MTKWKNMLVVVGVACAMGMTTQVVQAGCGHCGGDPGHKHTDGEKAKAVCAKCDHSKVCTSVECADPAHVGKCICPKTDDEIQETESAY